jgi:hypothetical protein
MDLFGYKTRHNLALVYRGTAWPDNWHAAA